VRGGGGGVQQEEKTRDSTETPLYFSFSFSARLYPVACLVFSLLSFSCVCVQAPEQEATRRLLNARNAMAFAFAFCPLQHKERNAPDPNDCIIFINR